MSKLQFESLRHEISHLVHAAGKPLSAAQLFEMCTLGEQRQIVDAIYNMCKDDQLARHPAPEGSGIGVKWLYGPGEVKLGAIPPQIYPPGKKPRKVRAVKQHKKRLKNSTGVRAENPRIGMPATPSGRGPQGSEPGSAGRRSAGRQIDARTPTLWALRSDGAFVLLGTQTEIQKPAARALVEFVRALDGGAV